MGLILPEELTSTPPKLSFSSLPTRKPPLEPLGALTPPLQPMVAVPFQWEEAPGRPKIALVSSPYKAKTTRCLDLPPRMLAVAKVANMPCSPTSVLDGPHLGRSRSASHSICFDDICPDDILDGKSKNEILAHFGSCKWASGKSPKWDIQVSEIGFAVSPRNAMHNDVDIKVTITRFRRSKRSLSEFSYKSSRLLESIYENLKQLVVRRHAKKRR